MSASLIWSACSSSRTCTTRPRSTLPASYSSNFLGRATKTTAKALKSRLWLQAASPMVNGNAEWYADFKNNDGTPLMPLEYDKELWKKAMDAAKDAIQQGEADGFQLYAPSKETDTLRERLRELQGGVPRRRRQRILQ